MEMTMTNAKHDDFSASTLGTWKRGTDKLTAMYHDEMSVRIRNSVGHDFVVTVPEWLDRYDGLRDSGWLRAA
jgi:hypothetical protein